jgi:deazaflavin-dependent oxidoreductase (nitroreductase family)
MTTANNGDQTQATTGSDTPEADETEPWNRTDWTPEGIKNWNEQIIAEFRANGGKVGGAYEGGDLILLTTTGARSGKPHTVPLAPLGDDDHLIVSSFIETNYPAWYHNLRANPVATIERGTETFTATAIIPTGEERDRLWAQVTAQSPLLLEHQAKATLPLPLVVFQR